MENNGNFEGIFQQLKECRKSMEIPSPKRIAGMNAGIRCKFQAVMLIYLKNGKFVHNMTAGIRWKFGGKNSSH